MNKITFVTGDDEYNPGRRIGRAVVGYIDALMLDTVNKEYVVTVEVTEVAHDAGTN